MFILKIFRKHCTLWLELILTLKSLPNDCPKLKLSFFDRFTSTQGTTLRNAKQSLFDC